jgi:hypothetical protein
MKGGGGGATSFSPRKLKKMFSQFLVKKIINTISEPNISLVASVDLAV